MLKTNDRKRSAYFLFGIVLALLLSCEINQPESKTNTPTPYSTPASKTAATIPHYLSEVFPLPDSELSISNVEDQKVGIGVTLRPQNVAEKGDFDVNWIERCSLSIDGTAISREMLSVQDGIVLTEWKNEQGEVLFRVSGPYYLTWHVPMDVGKHQAVFQVRRTSGMILEHSWQFSIVP
ncbi:MAG: hypothetical protein JXA33_27180 [Anaerolineae bacterium]|nr:hypothetical protein [Anaerolineae bacterium]